MFVGSLTLTWLIRSFHVLSTWVIKYSNSCFLIDPKNKKKFHKTEPILLHKNINRQAILNHDNITDKLLVCNMVSLLLT
jgi:hypothetical protein